MKRSRHEIIAQILRVCYDGASKTRLVYQANLNFKTIDPYIELLVKNGMMEIKEGKNKVYKTTDKGKELLENFDEIQSTLEY